MKSTRRLRRLAAAGLVAIAACTAGSAALAPSASAADNDPNRGFDLMEWTCNQLGGSFIRYGEMSQCWLTDGVIVCYQGTCTYQPYPGPIIVARKGQVTTPTSAGDRGGVLARP
jgi:hypothetical protein